MDHLDPKSRSRVMSRIRGKNTRPEKYVGAVIRSLRFSFTAHDTTLPGTPDFVLRKHKLVIFVHGCFWHMHSCSRGRSKPSTQSEFWASKRTKNVLRDRRAQLALRKLGYHVLTLWECRLNDREALKERIRSRLARKGSRSPLE